MKNILAAIFMLCVCTAAKAEYAFDAGCREAYKKAWAFKTSESLDYIHAEATLHPSNNLTAYLASLNSFISVFAKEEKSGYEKFGSDKDKWIDALDEDRKGPWYLFCKSEIYLESAVLKLKFSDYYSAAFDLNKAYNNLTDCCNDYPDFLPAQKDLLLLKAMVGSVPGNYRWMLKILGFSGDLKTAMADYGVLLKKMESNPDYTIFTKETRIIYAYLCFYMLNRPDEAWRQMNAASKDYTANPLDAFVRANMAMRLKKMDIVMAALDAQVHTPPPIPYLDYMMGVARLQSGSGDAAFYLARYITEYKGSHYIKDAYLKLGWAFLLRGNRKEYDRAMALVATEGTAQIEEDKNAQREAAMSHDMVIAILKARLYFDGGYYEKAKTELNSLGGNTFLSKANSYQQEEYYYRYARVLDAIGDINTALADYQAVIDGYSNAGNYFAPASCYYAALVWEKQGKKSKAEALFKKCLTYKGYVYKDSFDQKAYAGLKRVG